MKLSDKKRKTNWLNFWIESHITYQVTKVPFVTCRGRQHLCSAGLRHMLFNSSPVESRDNYWGGVKHKCSLCKWQHFSTASRANQVKSSTHETQNLNLSTLQTPFCQSKWRFNRRKERFPVCFCLFYCVVFYILLLTKTIHSGKS